jgi:activating signal cointegrator 1
MKVISLWQPYASLLVGGFKMVETRPYPCPQAIVGHRLYIASTKIITAAQRALFADEEFQAYYRETGLPAKLEDMPNGYLLGSVLINTSDPITEEDLEDITDEERLYGDWRIGRHAWRTRDPEMLNEPVPVSGQQGIWNLHAADVLPFRSVAQERK